MGKNLIKVGQLGRLKLSRFILLGILKILQYVFDERILLQLSILYKQWILWLPRLSCLRLQIVLKTALNNQVQRLTQASLR